jgi:hypothetical protein
MPGQPWRILLPLTGLLAACDLASLAPGMLTAPASGAKEPASASATSVSSATSVAGSDERARIVLDVAARDLACPRDSVALAMTLDRHDEGSFSLRYLVEGCGTRALYGEDCTHPDTCRYVLVSRMPVDDLERLAPVTVPPSSPRPALPPELGGLSVHLEPRVVGVLAHGDSAEQAMTACRNGDAELVRAMGWTVADDPSKADLVARFGCTGHIELEAHGTTVDMRLPYDGTASVVLLAGEHVVATVPPAPTHLTCDSRVSDAQTDCLQRAGAMTSARIAGALAASPELKEFAKSRKHAGP